jgi:glycosyltransferase involved in cell wall biosynthesis
MPCHITLLVRKLETGGAERQVVELARNLPADEYTISVVTFYPGGDLWQKAKEAGVNLICLNKTGRWDLIGFFVRLVKTLISLKTDIVHGFQGPPNLFALAARPFVRHLKVVWGIRDSNVDMRQYDYSRRLISFASARLSGQPEMIIANSRAGAESVSEKGYSRRKLNVIHNGIDTEAFKPLPSSFRKQWNLAEDDLVIGMAARFDVKKDHRNFLKAAAIMASIYRNVQFVLMGSGGSAEYRGELKLFAEELGLGDRVHWPGAVTEMAVAYNSLDILALSSLYGEGFPNTLGEAMACGVPCVTTDTGDSALIVGPYGYAVPPASPEELAAGWIKIAELSDPERHELSQNARAFISDNFSLGAMIEASSTLYDQLYKT